MADQQDKKPPSPTAEPDAEKPPSPAGETGEEDRKSVSPTEGRKSADDAGRKSKSPVQEETAEQKSHSPVQKEESVDDAQGDQDGQKEEPPKAAGTDQEIAEGETTDDVTTEQTQEETQEEETQEQSEGQTGEQTEEGTEEQGKEEQGKEEQEKEEQEKEEEQTEGDIQIKEETTQSPKPEPDAQQVESQDALIEGQARAPSATSEKLPSPSTELPDMEIPEPPKLPSPERSESLVEGTMSNTALNMVWSFGLNRSVPVLNLTDPTRKVIMYACAHVGILYDFKSNRQHILQGHSNPITCTCVSEDKRWLATGDKGRGSMVIVWDTYTGIPIQTIFDTSDSDDGGVVALAMTPDARYLATLSAAKTQVLSIWEWTVDGETPICSAELKASFGIQNFILFNPQDIHYLVTNSDSQVIFYNWGNGQMEYFAPPLTDQDFNKPVGRYSQSIFQRNSSRALTATSIGNLVVWDNNKPFTKGGSNYDIEAVNIVWDTPKSHSTTVVGIQRKIPVG